GAVFDSSLSVQFKRGSCSAPVSSFYFFFAFCLSFVRRATIRTIRDFSTQVQNTRRLPAPAVIIAPITQRDPVFRDTRIALAVTSLSSRHRTFPCVRSVTVR